MRQTRRRGAQLVASDGGQTFASRDDVTRLDEGDVFAVLIVHEIVAHAHEFVDVELVVGEQHEVLKPLGRSAGVMAQPMQRIIDAWRGEQRQRLMRTWRRLVGSVGDAVVHSGEVG